MIDDEDLQRLVDRFYAKVREDDLIGPIFNSAIGDWPEHLRKLGAFWSSVMNCSGRYKGNPMAAHLRHVKIDRAAHVRTLGGALAMHGSRGSSSRPKRMP